jgi:hypothetical protein
MVRRSGNVWATEAQGKDEVMSGIRKAALALMLMLAFVRLAPISALAASSYTDTVVGVEIAATPTEGQFVGTGTGQLPGGWYADVLHQPLSGSTPAAITGGSFSLATQLAGQPAVIAGSLSSGSIVQTSDFFGCSNQTYAVTGSLNHVGPQGSKRASGTGTFAVTLTHYQTVIGGICVTYSATVRGLVSLTF